MPYLGHFTEAQLIPVMEPAAPIPAGDVEWRDDATGEVQNISRSEAIVRCLEWLDTLAKATLHRRGEPTPSALTRRLSRIVAAADKLLDAMGIEGDSDSTDTNPHQLFGELRWLAERLGERIGGFPNHPPTPWRMGEADVVSFHGDRQLRDDIAGIRRIRDLAKEARTRTRMRIQNAESLVKLQETEPAADDPIMVDANEQSRKLAGKARTTSPDTNRAAARLSKLSGTRPLTQDPVTNALDGIAQIWVEMLGREISTPVDADGIAYGPMINFCLACLQALELNEQSSKPSGSEAIRGRIRQMAAAGFFQTPRGQR